MEAHPRGGWVKIDPSSKIGSGCELGWGAVIGKGVRIGDGVIVGPHTVINGPSEVGDGTNIGPHCVLGYPSRKVLRGGDPEPLTVDRNCVIRSGSVLYGGASIGEGVEFGHHALVREGVEIGKGSLIGTEVVIDGNCKIGSWVSIQTGAYICANSVIGDRVFLGPYCVLTNDKYMAQRMAELRGPTIESGASVGANAVIMAGVRVGEGAIIGAQALVNKDVPRRTICFGIPAKEARKVPNGWGSLLGERR